MFVGVDADVLRGFAPFMETSRLKKHKPLVYHVFKDKADAAQPPFL